MVCRLRILGFQALSFSAFGAYVAQALEFVIYILGAMYLWACVELADASELRVYGLQGLNPRPETLDPEPDTLNCGCISQAWGLRI